MRQLALVILCSALCACGGGGNEVSERPAQSEPAAQKAYTVSLRFSQPATVAEEGMTIHLTEVRDGRCPADVQCIWAGHAAATLIVAQSNLAPEVLVIGTAAPADLKLPYQAMYGSYQFTLKALEPTPTTQNMVPIEQYRATVLIEKI